MTVTEIADEAFMKRKDIRQVEFPKTLKCVGEYNQEIKGETNVEIISVIA